MLKRLPPKNKTNKQTNTQTNYLVHFIIWTLFSVMKNKKGKKHVSHKYKNKLDFPFSEILAKTMRENSSPLISRVTVIQELETEFKK